MTDSTKISVTITLKGAVIINTNNIEKIPYSVKTFTKDYKESNTIIKGEIDHYIKEEKPCTQHINMTKEAYTNMIGECPYFIKKREWERLNKKERLNTQLQQVCAYLNGVSFTYDLLED